MNLKSEIQKGKREGKTLVEIWKGILSKPKNIKDLYGFDLEEYESFDCLIRDQFCYKHDLDGIRELDDSVARLVVEKTKVSMSLQRVWEITPQIASVLATFAGSEIILGVKTLNESSAVNLANFRGNVLIFLNLVELVPEVANIFGNWKGFSLFFPAVNSLGIESARNLSKFSGREILFSRLSIFDKKVKEALNSMPAEWF